MKVWHIVPKNDILIPVDGGQTVAVASIAADLESHWWKVKTESAYAPGDMDLLRDRVCRKLGLDGNVSVEHQVTSVFHGGDMPLSIPENDPLRQIADISTDDLEGYGIPHEDSYESLYDVDEELYQDEDYKKPASALPSRRAASARARRGMAAPRPAATAGSGWAGLLAASRSPSTTSSAKSRTTSSFRARSSKSSSGN